MNASVHESQLYAQALAWCQEGRDFVLAVVVDAQGSTPRASGAKMLVAQGESHGTLGGGKVELETLRVAREMLTYREANRLVVVDLSDTDSPACGGTMTVFLSATLTTRRCLLVGAGHVAEALVPLLVQAGFRVAVADARPERLALPAFAHAEILNVPFECVSEHLPDTTEADILIMTPDHRFDFQTVKGLIDRPWRSLGVLGSVRKRDGFRQRLLDDGHNPEAVARLRIPVGLNIGAETPAEIALSIAAELVRSHADPAKLSRW